MAHPLAGVRLRTWFFLLAFPMVTVLIAMLGGTVWATRERVVELEQLKRDGASLAAVERLITALGEELHETAVALIPDRDGSGEAAETHANLATARKKTDSAFARLASLEPGRTRRLIEGEASPDTVRGLLDRMREHERA